MPEGIWKLQRKSPKSLPGSGFMPSQTFVLAHQPARQVAIQVFPHGRHRRLIESTIILMPATKYRVEHGRQVSHALVTFQLKMPTAYRLSHCFEGVAADCGCEIHIDPTILVDCFTRTEGIAKKRELDTLEISLPIDVLAVHDPGFLGMQFKSALTKPLANLVQGKFSLRQTPAVHNSIIGIAAKAHAPQMTTDPAVEGIVQKQIGQQRTDDTSLWGALCPFHQLAVRHLHWRF